MKTLTRILSVCISLVLLTSCTAHITIEPQTSPSPTATLTPDASSASASSSTGASESVHTAAPAPVATPKSTPLVSSSSETATSGDEALVEEAEFLVDRLVKYVFDGSIRNGIPDISAAIEEDPGILFRLPFILTLKLSDANLYASYGQYSEDDFYVYVSKGNAQTLAHRVLGLEELSASAFQYRQFNQELQRFEFPTAVGLLDINAYTDLTCTIDPSTHTVHARFILTDSGSYESNEVYGPYEMIFDIISDGDTPYLRFKSVLPV